MWNVFTIDGGIAFTDEISPVGDNRLRADVSSLKHLGSGRAWVPMSLFTQDGNAATSCARGALSLIDARLAEAGYAAAVGHELEFVLVAPDGAELTDTGWVPYGLTGILDRAAFLDDLSACLKAADIAVEQLHAEYGKNQFEFSLPPTTPVAAADQVVLAKIIIGQTARAHGLAVSFAPAPFPGSVGNGAHQHFSLTRGGEPVFSGGTEPYGMTAAGASAIAGVVAGLVDIQGLLTGSILSGSRLTPGTWSGAFACWGVENREASVRFLVGGESNPLGSNAEIKIVDPSANVYLATAAILGLALGGIVENLRLPNEAPGDPNRLTETERSTAGIAILSADPREIIDRLAESHVARSLVGDSIIEATVAVRRYEQANFGELEPAEIAARFRLAWSI